MPSLRCRGSAARLLPEVLAYTCVSPVHRGKLQRECLLVMSRDSGVESGPHDPLAKNLSGNGLLKTLILQGF